MLTVVIIVEGGGTNDLSNKSNESILNMKEVSFINGKQKVKHFIEDYPLPYYLVVNDLASPEILGDALCQWFEMIAQLQNGMYVIFLFATDLDSTFNEAFKHVTLM